MRTKDIAAKFGIDQSDFEEFLRGIGEGKITPSGIELYGNIPEFVNRYNKMLNNQKPNKAGVGYKDVLVTSAYNIDGYQITKYSEFISEDAASTLRRGENIFFYTGPNEKEGLLNLLKLMREKALFGLKTQAYKLGCNAVIGVDYDYMILEPETKTGIGRPYVFCVTANGNAVVIEKKVPVQNGGYYR